jgi:hypothetical protein
VSGEREQLRGADQERLREALVYGVKHLTAGEGDLVYGVKHLTAGEGDLPGEWDADSANLGYDVIEAVIAEIRSQAVIDFIIDVETDVRTLSGETEIGMKAVAIEKHDVPLGAFGYEDGEPERLQAAAWRASQAKP